MKNKIKLMIASTIGISAIIVPSIVNYSQNNNSDTNVNSYNLKQNNSNLTRDVNFQEKKSLENISTSIGPIVMKDNKTIESRDWYGYANWTLDISSIDNAQSTSDVTVVDWEYLQTSDSLFLITSNSYLIKINATTGEVLASADKTTSGIGETADRLGGIQYNNTLYVWSSKSTSTTVYSVDRNTLKKVSSFTTNGYLTSNKLQRIVPLDVGYNIAITMANSTSSGSTISQLKLTMVNDNLEPLVSKTRSTDKSTDQSNVQEKDITITSGKTWENIYIDGFYRSSSQSTLLFIDDKIYEVFLNKNTPDKSNIKEITNASSNGKTTTNSFNSSFIDANNNIVFKRDGDTTISNLTTTNQFTTPIDLSNANNNDLKQLITSDTSKTNKLKVYGVPTEEQKNVNSANNVYLVDPSTNFATGFTSNIAKTTNFYNDKLELKPNDNISISTLLPSQLSINNFRISGNGDQIDVRNSNAKFEVDDRKGELSLTLLSTRNAWYSQVNSVKTKTYLHYTSSSFKKLENAVVWAVQVFQNTFSKYTPGQITEELLDKNAEKIMPSSSITSANGYSNISRKFLIVERADTSGTIKVEGTFSYTDKYNTTINFTLNPQTFTIKKATKDDYHFEFYGQGTEGNGSDGNGENLAAIDINQISGNSTLDSLKKYIPSFINPDQDTLAEAFIKTQDSYPIANGLRNIYLKDWDNENGTVTVAVDYVGLDNKIPSSFARKFTGFKTLNQSRIDFKGTKVNKEDVPTNITSLFKDSDTTYINIKDVYPEYSEKISDEVTDIAKTYSDGIATLAAMGYSPIAKIINNDDGTQYGFLQVELDYTQPSTQDRKKLPSSFYDKFGLKNGKVTQVYFGFLPVSTRFGISLKNYNSPEVQNIVTNYNVESIVGYDDLLKTLDYKGFLDNEIKIQDRSWDGEKLNFVVYGKSTQYPSVASTYNFTIDWAPKFASIRERNLILAVSLTLVGIGVVAFGIGAYILRKNKIRRLLK